MISKKIGVLKRDRVYPPDSFNTPTYQVKDYSYRIMVREPL